MFFVKPLWLFSLEKYFKGGSWIRLRNKAKPLLPKVVLTSPYARDNVIGQLRPNSRQWSGRKIAWES
jgi:hypothetical protein